MKVYEVFYRYEYLIFKNMCEYLHRKRYLKKKCIPVTGHLFVESEFFQKLFFILLICV